MQLASVHSKRSHQRSCGSRRRRPRILARLRLLPGSTHQAGYPRAAMPLPGQPGIIHQRLWHQQHPGRPQGREGTMGHRRGSSKFPRDMVIPQDGSLRALSHLKSGLALLGSRSFLALRTLGMGRDPPPGSSPRWIRRHPQPHLCGQMVFDFCQGLGT